MAKTMKAAVWTAEGTFEIKDLPKPEIKAPNEVMARVRASGICGSDLHGWKVKNPQRAGRIGGHELAGEVVEVGKAVTNVKVGDRVAIESLVACGKCRWCSVGRYHLCPDLGKIRSETLARGFSQYVVGPSEKFLKLARNVKTEWAPLLDCYAVDVHAFQLADIKMYETIAVIGQGPMGMAHTDLANAIGVRAIALALRDFPLQVAKKVGAWATVNSSKEDPVKKVLELTDGYGVDSAYLQAGGRNFNPLIQALQMTKKSGKVMIVGSPTEGGIIDKFDTGLTRGEKMIMNVSSFSCWDEYSEAAISLDYMTRGKLHPADIITHRYPLEEINEAFEMAAGKKETNSIKVMIIQDKD